MQASGGLHECPPIVKSQALLLRENEGMNKGKYLEPWLNDRNMSKQYCLAQHVVCVWPPCCDVLRHVRCCWLQFENGIGYGESTGLWIVENITLAFM